MASKRTCGECDGDVTKAPYMSLADGRERCVCPHCGTEIDRVSGLAWVPVAPPAPKRAPAEAPTRLRRRPADAHETAIGEAQAGLRCEHCLCIPQEVDKRKVKRLVGFWRRDVTGGLSLIDGVWYEEIHTRWIPRIIDLMWCATCVGQHAKPNPEKCEVGDTWYVFTPGAPYKPWQTSRRAVKGELGGDGMTGRPS